MTNPRQGPAAAPFEHPRVHRLKGHLQRTTPQDVELWLVVLIVMALDIVLTLYGLERGLIEQNVIVVFGIETLGYAMLAFLKVPAIGLGVLGSLTLPETYRQLNLIGLATPWLWAVMVNLWMIVTNIV